MDVVTALSTLFRATDSTERHSADVWLREWQGSREGWAQSTQLLSRENATLEVRLFAAQTLRQKCRMEASELAASDQLQLRDTLVQLVTQLQEPDASRIRTPLLLALADLAITSSEWKDPVSDLCEAFGRSQASTVSCVDVLRYIAEEVDDRRLFVEPEIRRARKSDLMNKTSQIFALLATTHDAFGTTSHPTGTGGPGSASGSAHLTHPKGYETILTRLLLCWKAYIELRGEDSLSLAAQHSLWNASLRSLLSRDPDLASAAEECFVCLSDILRDTARKKEEAGSSVLALESVTPSMEAQTFWADPAIQHLLGTSFHALPEWKAALQHCLAHPTQQDSFDPIEVALRCTTVCCHLLDAAQPLVLRKLKASTVSGVSLSSEEQNSLAVIQLLLTTVLLPLSHPQYGENQDEMAMRSAVAATWTQLATAVRLRAEAAKEDVGEAEQQLLSQVAEEALKQVALPSESCVMDTECEEFRDDMVWLVSSCAMALPPRNAFSLILSRLPPNHQLPPPPSPPVATVLALEGALRTLLCYIRSCEKSHPEAFESFTRSPLSSAPPPCLEILASFFPLLETKESIQSYGHSVSVCSLRAAVLDVAGFLARSILERGSEAASVLMSGCLQLVMVAPPSPPATPGGSSATQKDAQWAQTRAAARAAVALTRRGAESLTAFAPDLCRASGALPATVDGGTLDLFIEATMDVVEACPDDAAFSQMWDGLMRSYAEKVMAFASCAPSGVEPPKDILCLLDNCATASRTLHGLYRYRISRAQAIAKWFSSSYLPLLSIWLQKFSNNEQSTEKCLRVVKHALKTVGPDLFLPHLSGMAELIRHHFSKTFHSAYLYLMECFVQVYAGNEGVLPLLRTIYDSVTADALTYIQHRLAADTTKSEKRVGSTGDPKLEDMACFTEDCYGMLARYVTLAPATVALSATLQTALEVSLKVCWTQQRDANTTVFGFQQNLYGVIKKAEKAQEQSPSPSFSVNGSPLEEGQIPCQSSTNLANIEHLKVAHDRLKPLLLQFMSPMMSTMWEVIKSAPPSHVVENVEATFLQVAEAFPREAMKAFAASLGVLPKSVLPQSVKEDFERGLTSCSRSFRRAFEEVSWRCGQIVLAQKRV